MLTKVTVLLLYMDLTFIYTLEPGFNEFARDWVNLFVKFRFCYIENLIMKKFRVNDQNVCYIWGKVNDIF